MNKEIVKMDESNQYTHPDTEELGYGRRVEVVEPPANANNWQPNSFIAYDEAWASPHYSPVDRQDHFGPARDTLNGYYYAAVTMDNTSPYPDIWDKDGNIRVFPDPFGGPATSATNTVNVEDAKEDIITSKVNHLIPTSKKAIKTIHKQSIIDITNKSIFITNNKPTPNTIDKAILMPTASNEAPVPPTHPVKTGNQVLRSPIIVKDKLLRKFNKGKSNNENKDNTYKLNNKKFSKGKGKDNTKPRNNKSSKSSFRIGYKTDDNRVIGIKKVEGKENFKND
ncbi:hypothetical protein QBC45DRAFT_437811 [Copromyces sp. CBS 386.78]|nr:hypothetical protein QBC45DRAFT_437811 [Copromyces sp. CBS 386.78]